MIHSYVHPPSVAFSSPFSPVSCIKGVELQLTGFDQKGVQFDSLTSLLVTPQTPLHLPKCSFTHGAGRHTHSAQTI